MARGTKEDPWVLKTPPGSSGYTMHKDEQAKPPVLVRQVGAAKLTYDLRAIEDLHVWLSQQGDWVPLPPLLEELGLAEVTHDTRNNRMRAL